MVDRRDFILNSNQGCSFPRLAPAVSIFILFHLLLVCSEYALVTLTSILLLIFNSEMSNGSSFSDGSDAPQVVIASPDPDTHKIPVNYSRGSEGKEVSSLDKEAFARNQPYGPSCYNHYQAGYGNCYNTYSREAQPTHLEFQIPVDRRRICGLRPLWFWIVAVLVVMLLIGATAGAVVGGMMRRQTKGSSPSPSTSSAATAELLGSQLSAVNWTDSTGIQRRAVFYQRNGTLHVSHNAAGEDSKTWAELNIEAQLPAGAVGAMNATPLAASFKSADASKDMSFSAVIYYLDTENNVRDLVSMADDLSTWSKGPLWDVTVAANPMSGLAAAAHMCTKGCLGDRIVVFQGSGGDLFSIHGPSWTEGPTRIVAANIGTPLALTQAAYVNGSNDEPPVEWTAEQTQLRLYYHRAQNIDEYFFNDGTPLAWTPGKTQQSNSFGLQNHFHKARIADRLADGRFRGSGIRSRDGCGPWSRSFALGPKQRRAGGDTEKLWQRRGELREGSDGPVRGQHRRPPSAVH